MRTRLEVITEIQQAKQSIKELQEKIDLLTIEEYQITDDKYRYEEKEEAWDNRKKGKRRIETKHMVGRRHWIQNFQDEDTGEIIPIERSEMVRLDGVWQL